MLYLASVEGNPEILSEELRWMVDMRVTLFEGDHVLVGVIGAASISVWSIGFVVFIYVAIRRKSKHIRKFRTRRSLGYFYNGFEPQYFWWELFVKRVDVLCCYVVSHTHLVYNAKAKLIMYMAIAGVFWA